MAKDVFISCSSLEYDVADRIASTLKQYGLSCWIANHDMRGSLNHAVEIPNAIQDARAFIVILSINAMESPWVPKEISTAIGMKKVIFPFKIDDSSLNIEFNYFFKDIQIYDGYKNTNKEFQQMLNDILKCFPELKKTGNSSRSGGTNTSGTKVNKNNSGSSSSISSNKTSFTGNSYNNSQAQNKSMASGNKVIGNKKNGSQDRKSVYSYLYYVFCAINIFGLIVIACEKDESSIYVFGACLSIMIISMILISKNKLLKLASILIGIITVFGISGTYTAFVKDKDFLDRSIGVVIIISMILAVISGISAYRHKSLTDNSK